MSLTFFLLSDIFLRGVKDALSYSSVEGKKKIQNVIFPSGFPEMGREDESRCWFRGSCLHKHLKVLFLPSKNNVRLHRS